MRMVLVLAVLLAAAAARAQDSNRPREFPEFRGTWTLDATATADLRYARDRSGQSMPVDHAGLPVTRTLVIATTETELTVARDGMLPEVYRFDGTETQTKDPRTGAFFDPRFSFRLVAGTLALTRRTPGGAAAGPDGLRLTEIVTESLSLREWNVLRVERQLSMLQEPPGSLRTLSALRNTPHALIYRRAADK